MSFVFTPEYRRAWKQRQRDQPIKRSSNAKYRCADCRVEVCKGAERCGFCCARNPPSRRSA